MRVRKKPVIVEAYQWFKNGDHPKDDLHYLLDENDNQFTSEGKIIRYYRHPSINGERHCTQCNYIMNKHGWIDTLEGGHVVCPGDWVITEVKGEHYPCKPDIFEETYEEVNG